MAEGKVMYQRDIRDRRDQRPSLTLYQALDLFSDNIEAIKQACIDNTEGIITDEQWEPSQPMVGLSLELLRDVQRYRIEERSESYRRALRAINAREQAKVNRYKQLGKLTELDIERARTFPIYELYEGKLKRSLSTYSGTCPFHPDRTPSFYIFKDNRYKCFGCGVYGDSISFYQHQHGVDFVAAVKALSR